MTSNGEDDSEHVIAIKSLLQAVEKKRNEELSNCPFSCKPLVLLLERTEQSKDFHHIVPKLTYKQQRRHFAMAIQRMSKKESNRFFSGLHMHVEAILEEEAYVPSSAYTETSDGDQESPIFPDGTSAECLSFLKCAAFCVETFLEGRLMRRTERETLNSTNLSILPRVYEVASNLHNILFSLHMCGPDGIMVQDAVLSMCEKWWLSNGENKESLIAQCLPLIVLKALDDVEFQKAHIKRLFKLREAFLVIDFKNPSSDSLRSLLLRLASNPLLLKLSEGRRFLSCLLRDSDLVNDLHVSFRAQIPMSKKSALLNYGEIYMRSWKEASEDTKEIQETIEHTALQDLMYASIHVASEATLTAVLTVLDVFFCDKKNSEIASLLYRLYNPILWRSLSATNPVVRRNAVRILEKIFPLHDPTTSKTKLAMEKATKALDAALQDTDPTVRIVASEATAKIAALFWDALPALDIRTLLNQIIIEHASDAASVSVRAAALEAITGLLDTPQSHAVLRPLLPSLGNLVHDKSERVRSSALKMLLKVKEIRGIRYYHVIPVSHLTARLSEESRLHHSHRNAISRQLTTLMLNSYFPQGPKVSGADQLQRTLTFFHTDPDAAVAFYANLVDLLDREPLVKFISMLLTCLESTFEIEKARISESSKSKKKRRRTIIEPQDCPREKLEPSNIALITALTETLCIMIESIMPSLRANGNDEWRDLLLERFSEVNFVNILEYFGRLGSEYRDHQSEEANDCLRTFSTLLRCMAQLPKQTVDSISSFIFTSMSTWNQGCHSPELALSHLAPLCAWGMTQEVTESLAKSIQLPFNDETNIFSPLSINLDESMTDRLRSHSRRQSNSSLAIPEQDPSIALAVVNMIFQARNPPSIFVKEQILKCEISCATIHSALERGIGVAEKVFVADTAFGSGYKESTFEYVLCLYETYGKFVLHKATAAGRSDEYGSQLKKLLNWTTEKALVYFLTARPEGNELRQLDLSRISNVSDSIVLSPPRQKSDLRRTPTRLGRPSPYVSTSDVPPFFLTSFTAALLQSACILFAEELVLGSTNSDDIASAAVIWCRVFSESGKETIEGAEHILDGMAPSFFRLAVQLCKTSSNFTLLKELVRSCEDSSLQRNRDNVKKLISSLLHGRFGEQSKYTNQIIETVISAAASSSSLSDVDESILETHTSNGSFWTEQNGCVGLVLEAIFASKTAAITFIQWLARDLCLVTEEASAIDIFKLKCLQELISRSGTLATEKLKSNLNLDRFKEGSKMKGYVQNLFLAAS